MKKTNLLLSVVVLSIMSTASFASKGYSKDIQIESQTMYYQGTSNVKSLTEYEENYPVIQTGYNAYGNLAYIKTFSSNKITGIKTWYMSGIQRSEVDYIDGKISQEKMYYQSGDLDFIGYYKDEDLIKEQTFFNEKILESEVNYEAGFIKNETRYYESGGVESTMKINKDNVFEKTIFDISGSVLSTILLPTPFPVDQLDSIVNRNGDLVTFYESGGVESVVKLSYKSVELKLPEDNYFIEEAKSRRAQEIQDQIDTKTPNADLTPQEDTHHENDEIVDIATVPNDVDYSSVKELNKAPIMHFDTQETIRDFGEDGLLQTPETKETKEIKEIKETPPKVIMENGVIMEEIHYNTDETVAYTIEYFLGERDKKITYDSSGLMQDVFTSYSDEEGWVK